MSDTTTTDRKPPTLADIVREKTDDGRRIIDFFIDVMEDRVDGAELCHRMDAAKELKRHKSGAAARFIDRYSGVPCRHILRRRPHDPNHSDGADPAPSVEVPAPFSNNLLSVLSAVDEHLMTMLVRAQTAYGDTIVEFLDDVMQNRIDGFRPHHRIAAAKELALHIVRDETPAPTAPGREPAPIPPVIPAQAGTHSVHTEPTSPVIPAQAGTHPIHTEHTSPVIPAQAQTHPAHTEHTSPVIPAQAGTHPVHTEHTSPVIPVKAGTHPAHTEHTSPVIPAQAGTHPTHTEHNSPAAPAKTGTHPIHTEHSSPAAPAKTGTHPRLPFPLETRNPKPKTLPRKPRRIRRQEGDARARLRRNAAPSRSPPW